MLRTKNLCAAASLSLGLAGHAVAVCPWDCGDGDGNVGIVDFLALLADWGQPGPCDFDGGGVGINDFLELLANWGPCPLSGACCNPSDGGCVVQSLADCNAAGGVFGGDQTDCTDTDNDRIPNVFELGGCQTAGPCFSGTDPNDVDTDGDWISDGDELYGTLDGLDLPAMGVDPCHQDILIETDRVHTAAQPPARNLIHSSQIARLVTAFANSGVGNPDGVPGIKLHIDYGQAPYGGGNAVLDGDGVINVIGNEPLPSGEFLMIKNANFASNRHTYFHYSLMCDTYSIDGVPTGSSGLAEITGDDTIVSMGQYAIGDDNRIGHIVLHELGHNLGLRHGGNQNRNYKPNYNSVMNFGYAFCGTDGDADAIPDDLANYSHGVNIPLDELQLVEPDGVTGFGPAIDWNADGDAVDTVAWNINCDLVDSFFCQNQSRNPAPCDKPAKQCYDTTCDILSDYDDWGGLKLQGIHDLDFAPAEVIFCLPDDRVVIVGRDED